MATMMTSNVLGESDTNSVSGFNFDAEDVLVNFGGRKTAQYILGKKDSMWKMKMLTKDAVVIGVWEYLAKPMLIKDADTYMTKAIMAGIVEGAVEYGYDKIMKEPVKIMDIVKTNAISAAVGAGYDNFLKGKVAMRSS